MASLCPCGCGRKVGFATKAAAVGVHNMDEMLAVVTPALEARLADAAIDEDAAAELRRSLEGGQEIRGWLLAHVHKEAVPGVTPDLLKLKRAFDRWAENARSLAAV